jgi:hypothetical protein
MISMRTTHGGTRAEYYDTETGEILRSYAPGDGSLRYTWADSSGNATGRKVTREEVEQTPIPAGWRIADNPAGVSLAQYKDTLEEHRSTLS